MIITMITVPYFAKLPILNIIGKKKKERRKGGESLIPLDRSPIGFH